jgi:hypothetical protein
VSSAENWQGPQFEYDTVPVLITASAETLNGYGREGWELVAVIPVPGDRAPVAYLKRRLR